MNFLLGLQLINFALGEAIIWVSRIEKGHKRPKLTNLVLWRHQFDNSLESQSSAAQNFSNKTIFKHQFLDFCNVIVKINKKL